MDDDEIPVGTRPVPLRRPGPFFQISARVPSLLDPQEPSARLAASDVPSSFAD